MMSAELHNKIKQLEQELHHLRQENKLLRSQLFGRKSEKYIASDNGNEQPDLFGPQPEATEEEIKEEVKPVQRERRPKPRKPLPKKLPRKEILFDVPEEEKICSCCGKEKNRIGEDVTEKLEIIPAQVYVNRYVRPKYACGSCKDGVKQAPLPDQTLPRANAGTSTLAWLIISKYMDHLPLYRLEKILARHGIDIPRSRMCEWLMEIARLFRPFIKLIKEVLVQSKVIGADETRIQLITKGKTGKSDRCQVWVYCGDDAAPFTLYDFAKTRSRKEPESILGSYSGYLQTDDYAAYGAMKTKGTIRHAGCWAHARRKFVEAEKLGEKRATEAIEIIGRLYAVEKEVRKLESIEEKQALRQKNSKPILKELRSWMDAAMDVMPGRLADAISYTDKNWDKLTVYAEMGNVPIDNNAVERAIRPLAVGRKNWLFAGSEMGGEAAATFFTLIESAKQNGLNPWGYIHLLLKKLPTHPINKLNQLLPNTIADLLEDPAE